MRMLVLSLVALGALFGGYWSLGAYLGGTQAAAMLQGTPELSGRVASLGGFPQRIEVTLEEPRWQSEGVSWQAEEVRLHAATLRPTALRADISPLQNLTLGGLSHAIEAQDLTGQITLGLDRSVRAAKVDLTDARFDPALGLSALGPLTARLTHAEDARYDIALQADALDLPPLPLFADPDSADLTGALRLAGQITLSDTLQIGAPARDLRQLDLSDMVLQLGDLDIGLSGTVDRDTTGLLDGTIRLHLSDWQVLHRLLRETGLLSPDEAQLAAMLLGSQAEAGGTAITLDLTLTRSALAFGPFTLVQLPPL